MEGENELELHRRCQRDRRVLLKFVLSGSTIKNLVLPPGAASLDDVDLDQVSVDYVLNCMKKGKIVELSEAIRDYHDGSKTSYEVTNPEFSGSPPKRSPPPVPGFRTSKSDLSVDDIEDLDDDDDDIPRRTLNGASDLAPILPHFATGTSDDDLRETAYEILLACAGASEGLVIPQKEKKKGKRARLITKFRRHKEDLASSKPQPGLVGLLGTMRVQMEIPETMDIRTRQGLLNAIDAKAGKRMDTLLVPLELLCCISSAEFPDEKAYARWKKRQLNILEEGLINHPAVDLGESEKKASELKILLEKIEGPEFLPISTEDLKKSECLRSLRNAAIPLVERPSADDLNSEVCHWADGYHLNVKLYEKLLLSVFDILDEGKFAEDVEEILRLLKSTWRVLGITKTIHYTCYTWVLIYQFVTTSEKGLLQHAVDQLKKIPLKEQRGEQEELYLARLQSKIEGQTGTQNISFLQAFLEPIQKWADKQLGDYHLHFTEDSKMMENVATIAMVSRRLLIEEPGLGTPSTSISNQDQIELFVTSSFKHAFSRASHAADAMSETANEHPLALLAEEMNKLLRKETTMFVPVLSQWHSKVIVVSANLVHKLYGVKLAPFLDEAEHLTEDVVSVFPAANNLEQCILGLLTSALDEEAVEAYCEKLVKYQIETLSGTLLMQWVNTQLQRIMSWVERAIQQEQWDPISPQQRYGSSIVDVYRIVDETVGQFFSMRVPMGSDELSCLCCGIDNAFQVYAKLVVANLDIHSVELRLSEQKVKPRDLRIHPNVNTPRKDELIPPVPPLTRFGKETGIKSFLKTELMDSQRGSEQKKLSEISVLPTSVLCVQLNTLHYALNHLTKLEGSISEQWLKREPNGNHAKGSLDDNSKSFDGGRKDMNAAIDRISEYTGIKIIFWDLREPFIANLYKPSVSESRMETLMEPLDLALNELCTKIMEPLRNQLVTNLLQASLGGLLRVLLDGGPSRIFSPTDAKLFEEDLDILKEFFFCGGDGLPSETIENLMARPRNMINLLSYETPKLIEEMKTAGGLEQGAKSSTLGDDAKTLLKILCHRGEPEASKFVKKHFKIPKAVA